MPQNNGTENLTAQQLFEQALSAQQQKNLDEALKLYQDVLDKGQDSLFSSQLSAIYHNMSTLAFEKSDFLHAYTWSKKALALDSGNHLAQKTFEHYAQKFEAPSVPHQMSTSQNFQKVLQKTSLDVFFVICLILMFATLHLFFKNILAKRKRLIETLPPPSFAWKPLVSFVLLVVFLALTSARWHLDQKITAIIVADKTGIQTAAGEDKPIIFEAPPGLEIEVLQFSDSYAQVRYPGAFSGWVPLKNIEILSKPHTSK